MALKTDYKDDIPKTEKRRYQMINNSDGTVSFVDVTEYTQVGDTFGAGDINTTNESVNGKMESTDIVDPALATKEGFAADALKTKQGFDELNSKLTNSENESFYFDIQNGVRGYNTDAARGADTFFPFSSLKTVILAKADYNNNCRDMNNIQPDVYNPEYINIDESGVISFKKACDVFVTAFCRSDVNNGWAHPELKIGSIKLSYGTRDSYNYTFLERPLRYVVVNEGDVFSFSKTHQYQLNAENGYGYVVMLSGR